MGNSQSYDLAQAQARANEGTRQSDEVVSQQDQFCRPVSMASTSSMRKPPKNKSRVKETDKENVSAVSSRTETPTSFTSSEKNDTTRESPVDVYNAKFVPANHSPSPSPLPSQTRVEVLTESILTESLLTRAEELEQTEIPQGNVTNVVVVDAQEMAPHVKNSESVEHSHHEDHYNHHHDHEQNHHHHHYHEEHQNGHYAEKHEQQQEPLEHAEKHIENQKEKERAKVVAEEAVKQLEKKRGSNSETSYHEEPLHRTPEVAKYPLGEGASVQDQKAIDEVTRQLDEAIDENATNNVETTVIIDESSIEYATVSLALDEDISAIETPHMNISEQKLFYTSPLDKAHVDALPQQTHYDKLNKP